jgi:hypothetical protein
MNNYDEIKKIKEENKEKLFSHKGVHAVGIGYRKIGGKDTEDLAILVYIDGKKPAAALEAGQLIPSKIRNVLVDIIDSPPLRHDILYANGKDAVGTDQSRYRPLIGGIQLYLRDNTGGWFGTLGIFVKSQDVSDDNLYILSNHHVLKSVGLSSWQPYGGTENLVASTSVAQPYDDADAAIASMNKPEDAALNTVQDIGIINGTKNLVIADLGKRVLKRGRTTCLTEGTLDSIDAIVQIGTDYLNDIAIVKADEGKLFSSSGDSGSPVVLKIGKELIGLHFAGNHEKGGISAFCKIDNVFKDLNIKLP